MRNNNENLPKVEQNIICWEKQQYITTFFFTYSVKTIRDNAAAFIFWEKALIHQGLLDDPNHQREFQKISEMISHLAALTLNYSDQDIINILELLTDNIAILKRITFYENMQ